MEAPYEICKGARDQEILLHEAQALPHARVEFVGVQHARQGFLGRERLRHRAHELTVAERLKVEVVGGASAAQSRSVLMVLPP